MIIRAAIIPTLLTFSALPAMSQQPQSPLIPHNTIHEAAKNFRKRSLQIVGIAGEPPRAGGQADEASGGLWPEK